MTIVFRDHVRIADDPRLDIAYVKVHPVWSVIRGEATSQQIKLDCCESPYSSMTVTLHVTSSLGPFNGHAVRDADRGDDDVADGDGDQDEEQEEDEGGRL